MQFSRHINCISTFNFTVVSLSYKLLTVHSVVIKHKPPGRNRVEYNRERRCYGVESIAQSPYIRRMHESIGHAQSGEGEDTQLQYIVFEWMDSDLCHQSSEPFRSGSQVPRIVAKAVLEALAIFANVGGVHTDVNPNNVVVSDVHGPSPTVKLGDLGNCMFYACF